MRKTVIHLPKGFARQHRMSGEAEIPAFYRRLQRVVLTLSLLAYILGMSYIIKNRIGWMPATIMSFFIVTVVLAVVEKIRPGAGTFWKSFIAVCAIVVCPWFAFTRALAYLLIGVYLVVAGILIRRFRRTFVEETLGWRAIAILGLTVATVSFVLRCLANGS